MTKSDTFVQIRHDRLYIQILKEEIREMLQYDDKTSNKKIKLEEIIPVAKITPSGITSALQLVDTTSGIKIVSNSSAFN